MLSFRVVGRTDMALSVPELMDERVFRLAKPRRRFDDDIETGCSCEGERLMTLETSLVAVWYSSNSCSSAVRACTSSNSRTFSIAITAWSAKVWRPARSACPKMDGLRPADENGAD